MPFQPMNRELASGEDGHLRAHVESITDPVRRSLFTLPVWCSFEGITCGDIAGSPSYASIVSINLGLRVLFGSLPPLIGNFHSLMLLKLDNNFLHGTIPGSMSALTSLSILSFHNNYLSMGALENLPTSTFSTYTLTSGYMELGNNCINFRSERFVFVVDLLRCPWDYPFRPRPTYPPTPSPTTYPPTPSPTDSPTPQPTEVITFEDIMHEGAACLQMAVYIPRLQTLTGSFQSHLRVNVLTIYVH